MLERYLIKHSGQIYIAMWFAVFMVSAEKQSNLIHSCDSRKWYAFAIVQGICVTMVQPFMFLAGVYKSFLSSWMKKKKKNYT